MELVEYAQAVDHSRMPLLLRVLNALGWYAFLADIPLMAYAYCLVMARNGFPNLTMDEGRLVGASAGWNRYVRHANRLGKRRTSLGFATAG